MIYHYCNTLAFESIIKTKQIWLTDITKLNDTSEYRSGFDLISEILKEKGLSDQPEFQEFAFDKINRTFNILIGCFSKDGDAGSQWGLYADDSKGLSIGFSETEIEQFNMFNRYTENGYQPITSHVKFLAVNYDKSDFCSTAMNLIDELENDNPILKNKIMALALRRLAAIYKDPYFKDEREIRAIVEITNARDDKYALSERVNAYEENALYHKLVTSYQGLSAIKEVIIGANCPFTHEKVESILHENGLDEVTVRHSSGRGRYRIVPKE